MDELDVGGKKYISSKRASEITGYAKDYIGQLARSGKVAGTRFGRAWYVDEAALMKHLGKDAPEQTLPSAPTVFETAISPSALQAAQKPLLTHHLINPRTLPSTWSAVRYLEDTEELFPVISPRASESVPENAIVPLSRAITPVRAVTSRAEIEQRVAHLVDGIRPQNAMLRTQPQVKLKPQARQRELVQEVRMQAAAIKREKNLSVHWSSGSFATAFAALVLVFGSFASFFVIKSVSIGQSQSLTASSMYGVSDVLDMLREARILEGGVESLNSFYVLMATSFGSFVSAALQFIGGLL
jgi:hypothetical protein